jgi:predicted SprT family Zn-dependent metalloprotease
MQLEAAKQVAEALVAEYPALAGWTVEVSARAVRTLGLCSHRRKVIRLSRAHIELNHEGEVMDTVRHEVAHALVGPGHGHGPVWRRMAAAVGARPVRCSRDAVLPPGRWVAVCHSCRMSFYKYRRPNLTRARWCRACGRDRGRLHFAPHLVTQPPPGQGSSAAGPPEVIPPA